MSTSSFEPRRGSTWRSMSRSTPKRRPAHPRRQPAGREPRGPRVGGDGFHGVPHRFPDERARHLARVPDPESISGRPAQGLPTCADPAPRTGTARSAGASERGCVPRCTIPVRPRAAGLEPEERPHHVVAGEQRADVDALVVKVSVPGVAGAEVPRRHPRSRTRRPASGLLRANPEITGSPMGAARAGCRRSPDPTARSVDDHLHAGRDHQLLASRSSASWGVCPGAYR